MAQNRGHARDGHAARPLVRLLLPLAAVVAGGIGWWVLVLAAIGFGRSARHGHPLEWLLLIAASVAAVGCLLVALWFLWRILVLVGLLREYQPRRANNRH